MDPKRYSPLLESCQDVLGFLGERYGEGRVSRNDRNGIKVPRGTEQEKKRQNRREWDRDMNLPLDRELGGDTGYETGRYGMLQRQKKDAEASPYTRLFVPDYGRVPKPRKISGPNFPPDRKPEEEEEDRGNRGRTPSNDELRWGSGGPSKEDGSRGITGPGDRGDPTDHDVDGARKKILQRRHRMPFSNLPSDLKARMTTPPGRYPG